MIKTRNSLSKENPQKTIFLLLGHKNSNQCQSKSQIYDAKSTPDLETHQTYLESDPQDIQEQRTKLSSENNKLFLLSPK